MRRRKLMIGLGALTAGGSAAFGTEAFTSVEAQRNVDVTVAGDQSAFMAIQPLDSENAGKYVDGSETAVELELDEHSGGSGDGVSQNAITQIEDLFRVVNQGSQPSSVYFEDSSDAVTFRVTQSTDPSTTGSSGQTLEGANNSVELAVGEQVAVGMTIDTMNHDVSGDLLDNVTLYAEADREVSSDPETPQPQYVVTDDPDGANEFGNIQGAIDAASSGAVIGVDGTASELQPEDRINLNKEGIILAGINDKPTINLSGDPGLKISEPDVTLRNIRIVGPVPDFETSSGDDAIRIESHGAIIENNEIINSFSQLVFNGSPDNVYDIEIRNNKFTGRAQAAIGQTEPLPEDSLTIVDNSFDDVNEGIGLGTNGPDILDVEGEDEIAQVIADNTFNINVGAGQYAVGDYTVTDNPPKEYDPDYTGDS